MGAFKSETKNQHYISQTEQRLNAANPGARPANQRIYSFDVVAREPALIELRDPKGAKIENTLSALDLFSFDVLDARHRNNLESAFQDSEGCVARHSETLLSKLQGSQAPNIKAEVIELFAAKLLNFLRNPHCVAKVLNTVGIAADYGPTDAGLREAHDRVLHGSKPHQEHVCRKFGMTAETYQRWLRALFIALMPVSRLGLTVFESIVKSMFETHFVIVEVFHYIGAAERRALLSDRGFNLRMQTDQATAFEFNISASCFARFVFCDPAAYAPVGVPPTHTSALRGTTRVTYVANNLDALVDYNQWTVFQCAKRVYSASAAPHGVSVTAPT